MLLLPEGGHSYGIGLEKVTIIRGLRIYSLNVFYNKLNADSEHIVSGYEAFADEFATILSRQLDS